MIAIADNHIVSMRYIMRNSEGIVLENTLQGNPVSYLQGGNIIIPILQEQLAGLRAGDKRTVCLNKTEGVTSEDFTFEVIIDEVRPASKEEILLGYPVQAVIKKCEEDCECYTVSSINTRL